MLVIVFDCFYFNEINDIFKFFFSIDWNLNSGSWDFEFGVDYFDSFEGVGIYMIYFVDEGDMGDVVMFYLVIDCDGLGLDIIDSVQYYDGVV